MPEQVEKIEYELCRAIQNGINNSLEYPRAYINAHGAFVIECEDRQIKAFREFASVFEALCNHHQITKIAAAQAFYSDDAPSAKNHTLTFNISPEDFIRQECVILWIFFGRLAVRMVRNYYDVRHTFGDCRCCVSG